MYFSKRKKNSYLVDAPTPAFFVAQDGLKDNWAVFSSALYDFLVGRSSIEIDSL